MSEKASKKGLNMEVNIGGVKPVDIMLFTKHLSVALKSGLTLVEGMEILADQAKGKLKKIIGVLIDNVRGGVSFQDALSQFPKYFSPVYVNMVRSGEASGTLEESLETLSVQLHKSYALKRKIRSAMIYPMLVFVAVFGLGMSVALFVLPKILPLFSSLDVELPFSTRVLIKVAAVFEANGIEIVIGSILGFVFLFWFAKRKFMNPVMHRIYLSIPGVGKILKDINLRNFCHTFGTLLNSGLTIDHSLKITAESIDNYVYRRAVKNFIPDVMAGNKLVFAIEKNKGIFPLIVSRMIGMGEKTGNLDQTLHYLSEFYEDAVDESTKNLATIVEPVMLIVIGLVVGMVAISILGPIYEITGNLG